MDGSLRMEWNKEKRESAEAREGRVEMKKKGEMGKANEREGKRKEKGGKEKEKTVSILPSLFSLCLFDCGEYGFFGEMGFCLLKGRKRRQRLSVVSPLLWT